MPSFFALLSLFSFAICLAVGSFVYFTSSRKPEHTTFMVLCLFNAYLAFGEFMIRQAGDPQTALFWMKVQAFWPVTIVVAFHFILVYIGKGGIFRQWWVWGVLYGPLMAISLATLLTGLPYGGVAQMPWGYAPIRNSNTVVGMLWAAPIMILGTVNIVIILRHFRQQTQAKMRNQAKFVALGYLAPSLAGFVTYGMPDLLNIKAPEMVAFGAALQELLVGYAIWRYGLFDLNPAMAAANIITTMSDMLIISDAQGRIVSVNGATVRRLGYEERLLLHTHVDKLFVSQGMHPILDGDQTDPSSTANSSSGIATDFGSNPAVDAQGIGHFNGTLIARDGRQIPAGIAVSQLKERNGYPAGFVVIARDMTEWLRAEQEKLTLIENLKSALANIKTLKGLIPICSSCRKVRNDEGFWQMVEEYVVEHADVDFSHSLCEACALKLYPDYLTGPKHDPAHGKDVDS